MTVHWTTTVHWTWCACCNMKDVCLRRRVSGRGGKWLDAFLESRKQRGKVFDQLRIIKHCEADGNAQWRTENLLQSYNTSYNTAFNWEAQHVPLRLLMRSRILRNIEEYCTPLSITGFVRKTPVRPWKLQCLRPYFRAFDSVCDLEESQLVSHKVSQHST